VSDRRSDSQSCRIISLLYVAFAITSRCKKNLTIS